MWWGVRKAVGSLVALRKESVDRNSFYAQYRHLPEHVALRKESVDRNCLGTRVSETLSSGRSPQGERG